jgi:ribokinase
MKTGAITIVASYNVGLFLKGQRLPGPGETVIAEKFYEGGGGKGSNQAISASVLGAPTRLVVSIGMDRYGDDALAMYHRYGVNTDFIHRVPTEHSGISVILIDGDGHNMISVAPGANFNLSEDDIDSAAGAFADSCIVGFQLENRLNVVEYGIRMVHALGVTTFLDPAPATPLPEELFPCIDYIKPNEHEAGILTGISVRGVEDALKAGHWFIDHGVKTAIVTLGELGAVCVTESMERYYLPQIVHAIDSTGAGDTFSGAFMAALSRGRPLEEAIRFANAAAALSVTRLGAVEAIPHLDEVEASQPAFAEVA